MMSSMKTTNPINADPAAPNLSDLKTAIVKINKNSIPLRARNLGAVRVQVDLVDGDTFQ